MGLLNYTTTVSVEKTTAQIMEILRKHHANAVLVDYDKDGQVVSISFKTVTPAGELAYRLPIDWKATLRAIEKTAPRSYRTEAQARRTAWRNIKDWVEAQMALLETGMAHMEQIFLPYMLADDGRTFYEVLSSRGFLIEGPKSL